MRRGILLLLVLAVGAALAWYLTRGGTPVKVVKVERGSVHESLDEDGHVKSQVEVDLAPRAQGRLGRVLVKNGARVRQGDLIAELDQADLLAAVSNARANLKAAQAQLAEARTRTRVETGVLAAEVHNAEAGRAAAEANLRKVLRGSRDQDVASAQAQVSAAEASYREAQTNRMRQDSLYQQGYVSAQQRDAARSAEATARSNFEQARQRLSLLQEGALHEEREVARREVDRAAAVVDSARSREGQVATLGEQEVAAAARVEAARAALEQAEAAVQHGQIFAPQSGVLVLEDLQPGAMLGPTTRIGRLVDPQHIWIEVLLDENDRGKVAEGQAVVVTSDAYPDKEFPARLKSIEPVAFLKRSLTGTVTQDEDRVFRSRVELDQPGSGLFPGMSVFAEVVLKKLESVLFVPREALVSREGQWVVLVAEGSTARVREVTTGGRDVNRVEVLEGLQEGDEVILNPGNMRDGARIRRQ